MNAEIPDHSDQCTNMEFVMDALACLPQSSSSKRASASANRRRVIASDNVTRTVPDS
jgi:hypothetical protein